jgi:hypothetical protein
LERNKGLGVNLGSILNIILRIILFKRNILKLNGDIEDVIENTSRTKPLQFFPPLKSSNPPTSR